MRTPESKCLALSEIASRAASWHAAGRSVVSTNGCFDLLHAGHVQYLVRARQCGDILVVGLNSDSSVRTIKGPSRPIHNQDIRALQLGGLESVDWVVVFDEPTPLRFLEVLRPDVHVKGGDYLDKPLPEAPLVASWGGRVKFIPFLEGFSSSRLLQTLGTFD